MAESAEEWVRRAEKAKKGGFFSFMLGGASPDDIASSYEQAAIQYKLRQEWGKAATCYAKAAEMCKKSEDWSKAASSYVDAGNCCKKEVVSANDGPAAKAYFSAAIEIYKVKGRFSQAGRLSKDLAEEYEADADYEKASTFYKQAADFYDMDEFGTSQYSTCIVKYAQFKARLEKDYSFAIQIFEKEAEKCLRTVLIKFAAREHFLSAGIMRMAIGDTVEAVLALKKYEMRDPSFASSREGQLLQGLVDSFANQDADSFINVINEYEKVPRLCNWKLYFLHEIKEKLRKMSIRNSNIVIDEKGEVDLS